MQRILFGDNQFFGVNHMSEEKARAQLIRFQQTSAIIDTLRDAYVEGVRVFMCTTHERVAEICDFFREHQDTYGDFEFYPCMPYAHKYANMVTERGMVGALKAVLPEGNLVMGAVGTGLALARKDFEVLAETLIVAEMQMFRGLKTPVIFMQNVLTDLLLGAGLLESFHIFSDIITSRYDAEPGYITMNLPRLLDALEKVGVENPIVCANINSAGFRMSGGKDAYERAIAERRFRPVAMSIFASGALPPEEAIRYVGGLKRVESIVFGASSRRNIAETVKLLNQYASAG